MGLLGWGLLVSPPRRISTKLLGSPANGKTGLTRGIVGGMFGPQSFGTWKDMPPVWSPLPAHYRGGGPPSLFHIGVSPGCIGCLS